MKHRWVGLMSDINTRPQDTYYWYRCANCGKETEHKKEQEPKPSKEGCNAKEKGSVFPLASI